MTVEPVDPSEIDELFKSPDQVLLGILQNTKRPVPEKDLLAMVEEKSGYTVSQNLLKGIISGLQADGYDVKPIYAGDTKSYVLIRNPTRSTADFYNVLGDVETPFIISGDHHMGSVGFTELGFEYLEKDIEEFSVSDVLMPGDMLQGRGVHDLEANDVLIWDIDDQIEMAVDHFNRFPKDVDLHLVIGNHENKIKGSIRVGLDVYKHMSPRVPNLRYYGNVAKLSVNQEFSLLMLHSSGGGTYARSYPAQKMWRELAERPDILTMGHLHWVYAIPTARFALWTMGGTLQRENAYLLNKGIISQVGWVVIEKFGEGTMDFKYRIPKIY